MFGIFAYPALGIYKSITSGHMSSAQRSVLAARLAHDMYFARVEPVAEEEAAQTLYMFQQIS